MQSSHWIHRIVMAPLSVGLICIVLGAAFGELLGIGAFIGMVSAFIAMLITSIIGGSPFGITSPTGPMTAVASVVLLSSSEGENIYPLVLLLAAIILIILAIVGATTLVRRIPNIVVVGFVNGIAVLIALQQIKGVSSVENTLLMLFTALFAIVINRWIDTRDHVAWRVLASTASVVIIMSALSTLLPFEFSYPEADGATFSALRDALSIPSLGLVPSNTWMHVTVLATEVALIALFDTLLTSLLMEKQTGKTHQHRREIIGQATSLAAVSTIAGVPSAQSTVPSMMYFQEGARGVASRFSLVIFAGILALVGIRYIIYVPDAVLSGIILKIAIDIADVQSLRQILNKKNKRDRSVLCIFAIGTIIATVVFSLNAAVIGFAFGFYLLNRTLFKNAPVPDLTFHSEKQGMSDEL